MLPDVLVKGPSRIVNLVYLFFGYYLASYIISPLQTADVLSFEQKIILIAIAGSLFGSFIYFIKPIDRAILFIIGLLILISNLRFGLPPRVGYDDGATIWDRTKKELNEMRLYYNSPILLEEKAKINGAFFFSLSILLSNRLLGQIGLAQPFYIFIAFATPLLIVFIWESISLIIDKLVPVITYYDRMGKSADINELKKAILSKDWSYAKILIQDGPKEFGDFSGHRSYCVRCGNLQEGYYCRLCGAHLMAQCPRCLSDLDSLEIDDKSKYCSNCGALLERDYRHKATRK